MAAAAVQEGSRWRHARPTGEQVAAWFTGVPLDEGMRHADFLSGVVLIPSSEKIRPPGGGSERWEQVHTPYVQVGTRVAYFHKLAQLRGLRAEIAPVAVPRVADSSSAFYNGHMPAGYWWHLVRSGNDVTRFLCATWRVALYEPQSADERKARVPVVPLLAGESTKQISGGADINGLAKAQTGAIGRALGVAGILTIGTGIATAEDMQELTGPAGSVPSAADALLPPESVPALRPTDPREEFAALQARALTLQTQMQENAPDKWAEFAAWYAERSKAAGWKALSDAPFDALKGIVARMERVLAE